MSMLQEFKEFAVKGNMLDMAVGIVIGAAFGTIVNSLVNDVIMPIVSGLFKLPDFSNLFVVLSGSGDFSSVADAREAGAAVLAYGSFINAIIAFLIIALALFFVVKAFNNMKKEEPTPEAGPTELDILMEIRDALKN